MAGKARALLERGRLRNRDHDSCDVLWLESARLEMRNGSRAEAEALIARALQLFPKSGKLWAEAIKLETRARQKDKVRTALSACGSDPYVVSAAGMFFWRTQKMDKARRWLRKATELDSTYGDAWVTLYAFEKELGRDEDMPEIEENVKKATMKHGERWILVRKKVGNENLSNVDVLRLAAAEVKAET